MSIRAIMMTAALATGGAFLAVTSIASAQQPSVEDQASELVDKGNAHFNLAEYDQAIAAYKDAYKLIPEPTLLWNIAQSYRQAGDCANALKFYKNYVREAPDGDFRAMADQRIPEMDACAKKAGTGTGTGDGTGAGTGAGDGTGDGVGTGSGDGSGDGTAGGVGTGTAAVIGPVVTEPKPKSKALHWASIAAMGVGGLSLATGGYFSLQAMDYADQVEELCAQSCAGADVVALEDKGEGAQRNATIFYIAGGVAIAAGVGLSVLYRSQAEQAPPVVLLPTDGGAMASTGWQF